jgi:hypothetical protein
MRISISSLFILLLSLSVFGQNTFSGEANENSAEFIVEWNDRSQDGYIEVLNGTLTKIGIEEGAALISANKFKLTSSGRNRLRVKVDNININPGSGATVITVKTAEQPFSFFLRDVSKKFPVYIPEYKVVVLQGDDQRTYSDIESEISNRKLVSKLQQIETEPEESFETVKNRTRNQTVPTWLGISRDIRMFEIKQSLEDSPAISDIISPKNSSRPLTVAETNNRPVNYMFTSGRGQGVEVTVKRWLEQGVLPILHSEQTDGEINYHSTAFVSLEKLPLTQNKITGTNFMVADYYSAGHMFTEQQQQIVDHELQDFHRDTLEQTVLYYRIVAKNTGKVPRYAWYKTPRPGTSTWDKTPYSFDKQSGFSIYTENKVFCISKLNGEPLPDEEIAVLLKPDETAIFEFYIPHSPVSVNRAHLLSAQSFNNRYAEAISFWEDKLKKAAHINVPEKRIDEMIRAGLLHLDLITYGKEPDGTLAPLIGVYSPIGTESSPIIQFYCSMGLHDVAKRSLMYFLDKQHDDGFIQNFNRYMVETGAALWSIGEYFRYSKDEEWIISVEDKIIKSCNYLISWRQNNKKEELRGKGYGMIDGKVADPEDPFHQFMLNGYGYLGIKRISEILKDIDPVESERIKKEADDWKQDIIASFNNSMAHSPVVPVGDGTWSPTVAPWPEATGLRALYVDGKNFFSHGTFTAPDALLGPLYLVFCEVFEPNDKISKMMLNYHSELFYQNNAAFSQPYYSRHNWIQLKQELIKPFLKTYYNTFSALADRETYTFWEHVYHVSPHKTHEEAWFLMETRWMLYLEDGSTLRLLPGIPRKWLEDGKSIELNNVASYFGPLQLKVESRLSEGFIEASVKCDTNTKPGTITIRLPHPEGQKPVSIQGREYDEKTETLTIPDFQGEATVRLQF